MKRLCLALIFCLFSLSAYPFWIWSPKTKALKNPKEPVSSLPAFQFEKAVEHFEAKQYGRARRIFIRVLARYPDALEAADSQYYIGRCLEGLRQPYAAFLAYQKVLDSYPNSKRINEIVKREYEIGEYYLNRKSWSLLGISAYDFVEHPALAVFNKIIERAPYSEYAAPAQYKLGLTLVSLSRFDAAREAFEKVIDNYPDSKWYAPAKYQLAQATSKASYGEDYDSTSVSEAASRLDEFITSHPQAQVADQAEEQLKSLRNQEAKKNFDIARFYQTQGKYEAARIYYQIVLDDYFGSDYEVRAQAALERIEGK